MLLTNEKIIKNKVDLLNLAEELGNVSKRCKLMGFSRETFYRYKTGGRNRWRRGLVRANETQTKPA